MDGSAVSEALGGHGLARVRKQSTPAPGAARVQQQRSQPQPTAGSASPTRHFHVADMGPAPFISPRFQQPQPFQQQPQQQQAASALPFRASNGNPRPGPGPGRALGLGLAGSGVRSPPRHTALTIDDPVATPARNNGQQTRYGGGGNALHFRGAPPTSIDTSPSTNPQSQPVSASVVATPSNAIAIQPSIVPAPGSRHRVLSDHHPRTKAEAATAAASPGAGMRSPRKASAAAAFNGASAARAHMTPPPPIAVLSSMFLRRKPPQPAPLLPPQHEPGGQASTVPHVLFFQDTDSETSSQRHGTSTDHDTSESSSHSSNEPPPLGKIGDPGTPSGSPTRVQFKDHPRKKRQTSHPSQHQQNQPHQPLGIEKLGELSRDEEGYDFAILLKPSKFEEHLEITAQAHPLSGDDGDIEATKIHKLHRAMSDLHSAGVASGTAGDDAAVAPVVVVFKLPGTPRSQLKKQKNDPVSARNQIIHKITQTGLQVKRLLSLDGKQTLLKVKAPQRVLEMGAERMKMRKLRKFDQIWMEFSSELRETFADFDSSLGGVKFIDSEKQSIVHSLLTSDICQGGGAGLNEFCPLKNKHVLKMFPLHKQEDLLSLRRHWVSYWLGSSSSSSSSASGEPSSSASSSCGTQAKRLVTNVLHQPIDQIAQYYGEQIAYYFAWIEMYTKWLIVPSVAGVLLFILQVQAKTLDHPLASVYAIFMAVWTSAFLLAWKRRAASLAYRWGTLGYEEDTEVTRPEYFGDPAISTEMVKKYPAWKRYAKYTLTVPTVIVSIVLVILLTFYAFATRDRLEAQSISVKAQASNLAKNITADLEHGLTLDNLKRVTQLGMDWDFWFYFLITPLLYGFLIPVLDYAWTMVAKQMTNWENHETESHFQSHLILKVFSFRFVHVFASLYYYAFTSATTNTSSSSTTTATGANSYTTTGTGKNLLPVAVQLASFMVTDQLWRNAMQTLYPFLMRRVHAQRKRQATNAQFHQSTVFNNTSSSAMMRGGHASHRGHHGSTATTATAMPNSNALIHEQCVRLEQASDHAWEEAELEKYDTFEDYTEMLIQFGYVTFFSLAFPLAPLLALLNNLFELRTDAFKLCHAKQRPIAQKASGIGVWQNVLQLMSVLAVLTNCLHIAFTTTQMERIFPHITETQKVWVVFCVEHVILALKVWMMVVVPSTPSEVQQKVRKERDHAKIESARAMAAKIQQLQLHDVELQQQQFPITNSGDVGGEDGDGATAAAGLRRRSRSASTGNGGDAGGIVDEDDSRSPKPVDPVSVGSSSGTVVDGTA